MKKITNTDHKYDKKTNNKKKWAEEELWNILMRWKNERPVLNKNNSKQWKKK